MDFDCEETYLNSNMSYLRYSITTGRSFKKIHRRKQRIIKAKIHKIIADVIKFRLDIRNTFWKELNVKAYENAVGKKKDQLRTYILFRFHNFFIMYRTLGDFAVEKPQKTTFQVSFISKHLPVSTDVYRSALQL